MSYLSRKRQPPAPIEVQHAFEALNRQLFDGLIDYEEYEARAARLEQAHPNGD